MADARITTFDGEAAVTLTAGDLSTTFLPELGMLGVSLTHGRVELLALPRTLDEYRAGGSTGVPLLHPWANRLGAHRFRLRGQTIDLVRRPVPTDPNGLPIHGTMHGEPFRVARLDARGDAAELTARYDFGARADDRDAFPFPHELTVRVRLDAHALDVVTTVAPTTPRAVPVSFGWHPFLRAGAGATLRLPARDHLELDDHLLPTGASAKEPAETVRLRGRSYDDHYRLGTDRTFVLEGAPGERRVTITFGRAYRYAQLYRPAQGGFVCVEPMTAPIDSLRSGDAPLVATGSRLQARFTLTVDHP